jgi:hypothetical protein
LANWVLTKKTSSVIVSVKYTLLIFARRFGLSVKKLLLLNEGVYNEQ